MVKGYVCMDHGDFPELSYCPECQEENKKGLQFSGGVFIGVLVLAIVLLMWL